MDSKPTNQVSSDLEAETTTEPSLTAQASLDPKAEIAGESSPTVRQIFSLPEEGDPEPSSDQWKAFQEKISQEVKGIKWTAAMPDLAPKICELLDIKIPNILVAAWKKAEELQATLEKSRSAPEEVSYLQLAEHTIKSEHKPSIDMKIKSATVKKIELLVQLGFNLKGFVLKIQDGAIREMQTGHCEVKGTIKYGDLTIAEKKLEPIKLPLSIPIPYIAPPASGNGQTKTDPPPSLVERIEL